MRKPLATALPLVALLGLAFLLIPEQDQPVPPGLSPRSGPTQSKPALIKAAPPHRIEVPGPSLESRLDTSVASHEERRQFAITGRFVTREGTPVEGVRMSITGYPGGMDDEREESQIAMSTLDGTFEINFDVELAFKRFNGKASKPGWTSRIVSLWKVLGDFQQDRYDMGDVFMLPGGRLSGIVLDQNGEPVEKVSIDLLWIKPNIDVEEEANAKASVASTGWLAPEPDPEIQDSFQTGGITTGVAHAKQAGLFETTSTIRAGHWRLRVRGKGIQSWDPKRVTIRPGETEPITINCVLRPPITGRIAGVLPGLQRFYVKAIGLTTGKPAGLDAVVKPDGTFTLLPHANGDEQVRLTLESYAPFKLEEEVTAHWGDDVEVPAIKLPSLRVLVLDARDDSPVENFRVSLSEHRKDFRSIHSRVIHEGLAEIGGLKERPYELYVIPLDGLDLVSVDGLGAVGPFSVTPLVITDQLEPTIVVRVNRPERVRVQVVDSSDTPVEGATVSLVGSPIVGPAFKPGMFTHSAVRGTIARRASAHIKWTLDETDELGLCESGLPNLAGETYSILAEHKALGKVAEAFDPSQEHQVLRFQATAEVLCEFSGNWPDGLTRVQLERVDLPGKPRVPTHTELLQGDRGLVTIQAVPFGTWRALITVRNVECRSEPFTVNSATGTKVQLRADAFLAAAHNVTILRQGQPIQTGQITIVMPDTKSFGRAIKSELPLPIENGQVKLPILAREKYEVHMAGSTATLDLSGGLVSALDFN